MAEEKQIETYFAPTGDGQGVVLGRGDVNNPESPAFDAFASVPSPDGREHEAILGHLGDAADGEPITKDNAAVVLAKAAELAKADIEQHPYQP